MKPRPQPKTEPQPASGAMPPRDGRRIERRRTTYRWTLHASIVGVAAMVAISVALLAMPKELRWRGRARVPPDRQALLAVLGELHAAWNPADRARIVDRARQPQGRFDHALHWVLAQPTHELVGDAIALAAELGVDAVHDDLLQLAALPALRAAALTAADRLQPLDDDTVAELLGERDTGVLIAAAAIAARRPQPPLPALVALLRDARSDVRTAALAALPPQLPEALAAGLLNIAGDADAAVAASGTLALARLPATAAVEELLVDALRHADASVRRAAAAALAARKGPLAAATQARLWELIAAGSDRATVAGAFLALERTHSFAVDEVEMRSNGLDAFGRYFAARLLLAGGRADGARQLFDLLAEGVDEPQLRFAILSLLAGLANQHVAVGEQRLRECYAAQPPRLPAELPAPALDL